MRVRRLVLHDLRLPLVHPFETSFGRTATIRTLLVEAHTDLGVGWGECPAGEGPFFSYETTETARHVIREFLGPALRGATLAAPPDVHALWRRVRGHPMAKAAVEAALWWARAAAEGRTLRDLYGGPRPRIESGISLGIEERVDDLLALVERAVDRGYHRIKIKIKPGRDVDVVAAVRVRFPATALTADANGAYRLADAPTLSRLDAFGLLMLEQPLAHDDLLDHAALARRIRTPICLDESIRHAAGARHAIEAGACRIVNIKPARVGGIAEARAVHDVAASMGVPVWCGGMLESGVGRVHNVAVASLPNFTLPGDISPSERYYLEDAIDPPVEMAPDGTIDATRPLPRVRAEIIERHRVGRDEVVLDV